MDAGLRKRERRVSLAIVHAIGARRRAGRARARARLSLSNPMATHAPWPCRFTLLISGLASRARACARVYICDCARSIVHSVWENVHLAMRQHGKTKQTVSSCARSQDNTLALYCGPTHTNASILRPRGLRLPFRASRYFARFSRASALPESCGRRDSPSRGTTSDSR